MTGASGASGVTGASAAASRYGPRLVRVAWLVVVWVLLWGTFSWANLLSGLLVAALVLFVFPLPRVAGGRPLRPLALLRVAGGVLADLAVSAVQVAWQSVRPGPPIRSSIVEVRLSSTSELLMAFAVETLSLVPGSVVIEARPDEGVLHAHVLGADDDAAADAFRRQVRVLEERLSAAGLGEAQVVATTRLDGRTG